ncbi:MAG: HEAT repeat domain-containing protein [Deltaproteobacteria bacterium]|jgi:HEAT repeat protein|nr:HEAT repeat domain-containing protein [Deltaproteobacteria bacterium]
MGIREKRRITKLLESSDIEAVIHELRQYPAAKAINPLIGGLCSNNETVRWHAVTALGQVVADLAGHDMEAARIVMRRLMWSLNDESGGIGWGAPEAMGEIMACHDGLAEEYTHILVAYMREDGFYLELEQLQHGLMWGLARLALVKPELLNQKNAAVYLMPYLRSVDSTVRGLAAWTLGLLGSKQASEDIAKLIDDPVPLRLFLDRTFVTETVGGLAHKALANIAKES